MSKFMIDVPMTYVDSYEVEAETEEKAVELILEHRSGNKEKGVALLQESEFCDTHDVDCWHIDKR